MECWLDIYIKKKTSAIGWSPVYLLVASRASQGNTSLFVNLAGEIAVSNLMPLGVRKWPIVINALQVRAGGKMTGLSPHLPDLRF